MPPPVDWRVKNEKEKGRRLIYATTHNLPLIMTFCGTQISKISYTPSPRSVALPPPPPPLLKNPGYATNEVVIMFIQIVQYCNIMFIKNILTCTV